MGEHYGMTDDEWQMSGDPFASDAVLLASEAAAGYQVHVSWRCVAGTETGRPASHWPHP